MRVKALFLTALLITTIAMAVATRPADAAVGTITSSSTTVNIGSTATLTLPLFNVPAGSLVFMSASTGVFSTASVTSGEAVSGLNSGAISFVTSAPGNRTLTVSYLCTFAGTVTIIASDFQPGNFAITALSCTGTASQFCDPASNLFSPFNCSQTLYCQYGAPSFQYSLCFGLLGLCQPGSPYANAAGCAKVLFCQPGVPSLNAVACTCALAASPQQCAQTHVAVPPADCSAPRGPAVPAGVTSQCKLPGGLADGTGPDCLALPPLCGPPAVDPAPYCDVTVFTYNALVCSLLGGTPLGYPSPYYPYLPYPFMPSDSPSNRCPQNPYYWSCYDGDRSGGCTVGDCLSPFGAFNPYCFPGIPSYNAVLCQQYGGNPYPVIAAGNGAPPALTDRPPTPR